jgi:uncharacterized protein (TIGR03118 family)
MRLRSDGRRRLLRHGSRRRLELLRLDDRCLPSSGYGQVNLASDVPGLARVTDPHLVNPWGISFSPTGPFWFAENGSGVSDLLDGRGRPIPLVVAVERGGTPTGTVFNGGPGFLISESGVSRPGRFLFATEDGTITGWSALVDPNHALVAVDNSAAGAVYKGLALAEDSAGQEHLYATDFGRGEIDVFDQAFHPIARPGAFQDPNLPASYAPFNIQAIGDRLFVTYARQNAARHDDVAGPGNGLIDVYDTDGNLLQHFAAGGALDSPWGIALAPADFGPFGGALLVGNNGDGRINAFDPATGAFLGQMKDTSGNPIAIAGLWSLTFGNDHLGGAADTLFFTAGIGKEAHGLFGAIQSPQRLWADTAGPAGFDPHAPGEPGDYPLPPSTGPALQDKQLDTSFATVVLLPAVRSSLVLIPTLSIDASSATRVETSAPVTSPVVSAPAAVGTTQLSGAALGPGPADYLPTPKATANNPMSLSAFLDLNPSATDASDPVANQPEIARIATSDSVSLAAVGDIAAERLITAAPQVREMPFTAKTISASLVSSIRAEIALADTPARIPPEQLHGRGRWISLLGSVLGAISFPVIYAILNPSRERSTVPLNARR